jgi:hypothetical protein
VIDVIVQQALAAGNTGPLYHALTRPTTAEAEAVHRVVALSELAGGAQRSTSSTSPAKKRCAKSKLPRERGLPVQGETCTQYLVLSIEDDMGKPGFEDAKYVFTPPLRKKKNQAPLWQALKDDVLQVVSTDHCPFRFADQKTLGLGNFTKIPNGGPGIENRMQLTYHHGVNEGRISLQRFVELTAEAPAKIFGMYPKKGIVAAGSDADILIWDPEAKYTITAATQKHAHRLLHLRRLSGQGQRPPGILARRTGCRPRQIYRQRRTRSVSASRGAKAMSLYVEGPTSLTDAYGLRADPTSTTRTSRRPRRNSAPGAPTTTSRYGSPCRWRSPPTCSPPASSPAA